MNETPIVVDGMIYKYTTTQDGCLRIIIDLDEVQTHKFHATFNPAIGCRVAIARLSYEPAT